MGVTGGAVLGLDGGNSKTDLVLARTDGAPIAFVRGPGTNSHAVGAEGAAVIAKRLAVAAGAGQEGLELAAAALFCCGADLPEDIEALHAAFAVRLPARQLLVDNDTFALLYTEAAGPDAVAVVCGSGINVVGQDGAGRVVRYPGLGWESGDWGGGQDLGHKALFLAARSEDGRGEPTVLAQVVEQHFRASVAEVGAAVHYRRLPESRLGELAPAVVAAADHDAVAGSLVDGLAEEVALMASMALRDMGALGRPARVVLGGGMLLAGGLLERRARSFLAGLAPKAEVVVSTSPPVVGAVVKALELAGAAPEAAERFRAEFEHWGPPVSVACG